jgi:hypothetical protein
MTTTLYRFFDADDELLYVGISGHPLARIDGHATTKPWFPFAVRATFEHHPDRQSALAAEERAITTEGPYFNVTSNLLPNGRPSPAAARYLERSAIAAARRHPIGDKL